MRDNERKGRIPDGYPKPGEDATAAEIAADKLLTQIITLTAAIKDTKIRAAEMMIAQGEEECVNPKCVFVGGGCNLMGGRLTLASLIIEKLNEIGTTVAGWVEKTLENPQARREMCAARIKAGKLAPITEDDLRPKPGGLSSFLGGIPDTE